MQGLVLEGQPLVPHQCQTFCWQHLQKEHKAKLDAHVQKCVFAWMVSLLSDYRHHRLISECDSPMAFTALVPAVCPSSRDWINTSLLLSPPTRVSCAEEGSIHGYCVLCMPVYVSVCVCVCVCAWICSDLNLVKLHQNRLVCMSAVIKHQISQQGQLLRTAVAVRYAVILRGRLSHLKKQNKLCCYVGSMRIN